MKFNHFLTAAAAMLVLLSCNKEPLTQEGNSGNLYMQFSVKMLSTRSSTDTNPDSNSDANPDIEVGLDKENKISTVDIALVKDDQYYVAEDVTPSAASADTYVASFNSVELTAGATYKVYIYANCSAPSTFNIDEVSNATVADRKSVV